MQQQTAFAMSEMGLCVITRDSQDALFNLQVLELGKSSESFDFELASYSGFKFSSDIKSTFMESIFQPFIPQVDALFAEKADAQATVQVVS